LLTEKERETLEAIIAEGSIKKAAEKLGVKRNTLSQRILRMKLKEHRYQSWLDEYRRLKLRMPLKYVE